MPATVSARSKSNALAAEPTLRNASVTAGISAAPSLEDAAKTLITSSALLASNPNWFNALPKADAASGSSMPAASARVTAERVTSSSAAAFANKSGFALAISLNASAACEALRLVVLPISLALSA